MSEPISEVAFNLLPQAVKDWMQEIGWKREDLAYYHVHHSMPKVVEIGNMQGEKHTASFAILKSGMWKRKVEKANIQNTTSVTGDITVKVE